jgi:ABC-type sugar transport system permease subunit
MVFSSVRIDIANNGFIMEFSGLENLKKVFLVDAQFNRMLTSEIRRMLLIVPAIIIFSLFVAILLNQQFRGRAFVRAVFFLPVILSSGIMIGLETNNALLSGMAQLIRQSNLVRSSITGVLESILAVEGESPVGDFMRYVFIIVNQIYTIAMASAIQIIIFLSALQTIPSSMFEAAEIEGAAAWECFWKITFPMVSSLILVNIVYSVVDFFLRTDNPAMTYINTAFQARFDFSYSTTMAWVYFLVIIIIIGISAGVISRKAYYYE